MKFIKKIFLIISMLILFDIFVFGGIYVSQKSSDTITGNNTRKIAVEKEDEKTVLYVLDKKIISYDEEKVENVIYDAKIILKKIFISLNFADKKAEHFICSAFFDIYCILSGPE